MQRGEDAATAAKQALRLLDARTARQAAVLAYNHVFALVTVLFLVSIPLVLLLRSSMADPDADVIVE